MPHKKVSSIKYLVSGIKNTKYKQSLRSSSLNKFGTAGLKILNTKYCKPVGFTLIEFLVVLGILAVTVGSLLLVLTSVLRGTNQANITVEVKQNGQAVLSSLETQIRNAREAKDLVPLPAGATDGINLTLAEGANLYVACFPTAANSNGSIKLATSASPSYAPVTNQDLIAGVDVTDCSLSVIPATSVSPAIVSVAFVISQGKNAPSRQDFNANQKFATTISLRRY